MTDTDLSLLYNPQFREWGIYGEHEGEEGGGYVARLSYCPWCGTKLAESVECAWIDEQNRRGIPAMEEETDLPGDMLDDRWWKAAGL